jgi:hypothetical protein
LAATVVLVCSVVAVGIWLVVRAQPPQRPQISAYTNGQLTRVGPYKYCNTDLSECETPRAMGELHVTDRYPVQLSVPSSIARAPWFLIRLYEDPAHDTRELISDTKLAVTVATTDPARGRLVQLVVWPLVLVASADGQPARLVQYGEWSVRMVWP